MPKVVDHDARREQIALATCRIVARYGFERATVARIAAAAGYTTGMLAHYFDSKQEILLAALRLILRRVESRLTEAGHRRDQLLQVLCEALPIDAERRAESTFWMAFWGQVSADREVRRLNAWVHREYVRLFGRCIAAHWVEWGRWSPRLRREVLGSLMTFLNGLTASAVTSAGDWPAVRQQAQLSRQLQMLRRWARGSARRAGPRATR